MQSLDELAQAITSLPQTDQEALLGKIAQLNFENGLNHLAEKYRARLAREGRLDISAEHIWTELHRLREEVADRDYPN